MGVLHFNPSQCLLSSAPSSSLKTVNNIPQSSNSLINLKPIKQLSYRGAHCRIIRVATDSQLETAAAVAAEETKDAPPCVNFAFVAPVLLPDGTPDVHYRTASGGQKLRNIMLDADMDLYGPYSRPLLNCAGGGTCGTCIVEIIEGKQLLSPKNDIEKAKLKKNPKNWRLACQTTVGDADSNGLLVVQQLPEWKGHSWGYEKVPNEEI